MTATIIKNVLLLRYLEPSLPSGSCCLITHMSLRCTVRRQGCCDTDRQSKGVGESGVCVLPTIQFDLFNSSIHIQRARSYSGSLVIYEHFFLLGPFLSLSVRAQPFNSRLTHFFQLPLTYHLHTPRRRSYGDTH